MALIHFHCKVEALYSAVISDVSVSKWVMDKFKHAVDHVKLNTQLGSHSARFEYNGLLSLVFCTQSANTTIEVRQMLVKVQVALLDVEGRQGSRLLD